MNFDVAEKYGKAYFMPPEVTYDWVNLSVTACAATALPKGELLTVNEKV